MTPKCHIFFSKSVTLWGNIKFLFICTIFRPIWKSEIFGPFPKLSIKKKLNLEIIIN